MGERISAREFVEWQVWYRVEEQHPAADRLRHAQSLAAIANGQLTRKNKKLFTAAELMTTDPWAPPPEPKKPPTGKQLAAQVASINKVRRKRG